MKKLKIVLLLAVLQCTATVGIIAQSATKADTGTITQLQKFRSDYIKGMLDQKPEIIQAWYADDVRFMTEFQKTIIGKANALTYFKAFLSRFTIRSYTRTEIEIFDLGEMVLEFGTIVMKVGSKKSQKNHELTGNYIDIWKREKDKKLVLITDGWDYNHQVDIGDELRFSEVPSVDMAVQAHVPINNNISLELAALNSLLEETITQHDGRIWAQFYSDDATIYSRRHGVYKGRKAIDEHLESHAKEMPVFEKLDLRTDRIDDLGQYVIEYATGFAFWRGGEYSGVSTGKDIRLWRREPGGTLKILRQIGMYD